MKNEFKITNNIRTLRFHAGEMTQAELAEKVGVTRQTINAIEAAKYSPALELALISRMCLKWGWKRYFSIRIRPYPISYTF